MSGPPKWGQVSPYTGHAGHFGPARVNVRRSVSISGFHGLGQWDTLTDTLLLLMLLSESQRSFSCDYYDIC
jgi:hypothetical protein